MSLGQVFLWALRFSPVNCHFIKTPFSSIVHDWYNKPIWGYSTKGLGPVSQDKWPFFYLVCEAIGTVATPGLLCQPRVIVKMIVEKQMECRLAGEVEVLGENLPQRLFCPSQNPTWSDPCLNSGCRCRKTNDTKLCSQVIGSSASYSEVTGLKLSLETSYHDSFFCSFPSVLSFKMLM
jgi:hypothetical protein